MKSGWHWPVLVVAILAGGVGANLLLLARATGDPSFAVEPDYYEKAIAWDAHQEQARDNAELGWHVEVEVGPGDLATGRARVTIRLTDRDGLAVSGATLELEAFHNARAATIVRAAPAETPDHTYEIAAPVLRPGLWEFRLTARRGAETFTSVVERELAGSPR